jgi:pre-mRNA-processing factor 17
MEGLTVFEAKTVRSGEKRKREEKGDPGDIDGYKGPWREYVGQVKVAKPTEEEKAAIELLFADKKKKKEKKSDEEQTMEESSLLHGVCPGGVVVRPWIHSRKVESARLRVQAPSA